MAGSRRAVPRREIAEMCIHHLLHVRRYCLPVDRPDHEMEVVWHDRKRQEANVGALGRKCQSPNESKVIRVLKKDPGSRFRVWKMQGSRQKRRGSRACPTRSNSGLPECADKQ